MAAKVNWGQFIGGIIKHSVDIGKVLELGDVFIKAEWTQKWPAFRDLMDVIWPVILDMGLFSAQDFNVAALEAQVEALGFDGSRLKKLFELLAPIIIPIVVGAIQKK
jgi:hypothetical protein